MDIDAKLSTINHAIQELRQTQRTICGKVHRKSEDTLPILIRKQFYKLEEIIRDLEDKYGKHYSTLKEVTNMVVTLLSRVDELTIDIKKLKRFTSSTKSQLEDITDQTCHLRKTPTVKSNKRKISTFIPNEQKTPTVKANERSGTLQDSQNINEDNDLFGGISGRHTDCSIDDFECEISSQISSVDTHPDGRKNNSDNTDNFGQTVSRIQNSDRRDGNFVFSSYEAQLDRTNKTDTEDKFADKVHRINYSDRKDRKTNVSSNEAQIDQPNNTDTEDSFCVEETQDKGEYS
ncbi:unnamed protein product [Mytilus edulis]|uniref:Uncharacterized protein n=1 Tax=Mytilus edulis TaxID=6550 RepID=A0A8S3SW86_MYTED|nr:unnamed protein product [Mytilus edulis]